MNIYKQLAAWSSTALLLTLLPLYGAAKPIPDVMKKIMDQPKYKHAIWGLYVKDLQTGEIIYDQNSDMLFSPASTSKLFSVDALLNAYGDDYRFKTPIFAVGEMTNGILHGDLILVAQGDLTMGGRQSTPDTISYTKLDHIIANEVPGVILTKEDPLTGFNNLAKQVYDKGIKEIDGDVEIDDSLFETSVKRGLSISPILLNENLIDVVLNPNAEGQSATVIWRPAVPGYEVINEVKTVAKGQPLNIQLISDDAGHKMIVQGTIPVDQHDIVRTFSVKNPKEFARAALIQALENQGVKVNISKTNRELSPSVMSYQGLQPVAVWTSPPLSQYAKLILKVSHNLGADLVPLLLAAKQGKKSFDEGMLIFGDFVTNTLKISPDAFVFIDAAGGNENRLTPQVEVQLLENVHQGTSQSFKTFFDALPILGVDGSLEDFAKSSPGAGKVRAKPGTGVAFNLSTGKFFLITQALAGYVEGKNGHLYAYMLAVNNGTLPTVEDVFPVFEDVSQLSSMIYTEISLSDKTKL